MLASEINLHDLFAMPSVSKNNETKFDKIKFKVIRFIQENQIKSLYYCVHFSSFSSILLLLLLLPPSFLLLLPTSHFTIYNYLKWNVIYAGIEFACWGFVFLFLLKHCSYSLVSIVNINVWLTSIGPFKIISRKRKIVPRIFAPTETTITNNNNEIAAK